jgi:ABC-type transporter Mla subunit MlaD
MSETALLYVMAAFVIISAIALCIQAGMLAGIYKTTKAIQDAVNPLLPKVQSLIPKVESLVERANSTVEQSGRQITEISAQIVEITTRANDILDSTKRQLAIVEDVVGDAAVRAKVQMERVELVLDDTLSRAHETVAVVHEGVMKPLREVTGLAAGVRAAFGSLARGNRPTVDRATSDEEMFI